MKSIRQLGWDFAHNHRAFAADVLGPLGILPLKWSEWYQDCLDIYWRLDVRDKVVLDIGSDFGTTPMFFLTQMGAKKVVGVSLESQYFSHMNYHHYKMPVGGFDSLPGSLTEMAFDILKVDAEGLEWDMEIEFIEPFHDWIIALHRPILNPELFEWIKAYGKLIATKTTEEFAVYQKREGT